MKDFPTVEIVGMFVLLIIAHSIVLLMNEKCSFFKKFLWFLIIISFPVVGSVLYYINFKT
jgi:hypothetical protein